MKIYCLYGVGLRTERAYFLKRNTVNVKQTDKEGLRMCNNSHFDPPLVLNTSVDEAEHDIAHGVKFSDGDGSVPLLSLGYLCVDAWKRKELNPSGSKVITREYPDSQEFTVDDPMRGGTLE
jgi:phospholipid:diacylglycerol acyltransferase